jgi:hypothetical protein
MEQEPHVNQPYQQTSDMQDLKSMMKSLFEQMGTTKFQRRTSLKQAV